MTYIYFSTISHLSQADNFQHFFNSTFLMQTTRPFIHIYKHNVFETRDPNGLGTHLEIAEMYTEEANTFKFHLHKTPCEEGHKDFSTHFEELIALRI